MVHFEKRTEMQDYLLLCLKKVLSIHKRLPPGGVLIFLPGQQEIEFVVKQLLEEAQKIKRQRAVKRSRESKKAKVAGDEETVDFSDIDSQSESEEEEEELLDQETKKRLVGHKWSYLDLDAEDSLLDRSRETDQMAGSSEKQTKKKSSSSEKALPEPVESEEEVLDIKACALYARLEVDRQQQVFELVDEKKERLIVVATNVAETSITIPGIRYVVDSGREKVRVFHQRNGVSRFEIKWISKASAAQRAGRAGKSPLHLLFVLKLFLLLGRDTQQGHCYRLYSSAVYET